MLKAFSYILDSVSPRKDDDSIDRLNYSTTAEIILCFILFIVAKQYISQPIQCWQPAEHRMFPNNWEVFIEDYCYMESTYFVNSSAPNMPSEAEKLNSTLKYYQYFTVILTIQFLLFLVPKKFWSAASESTGLDTFSIMDAVPPRLPPNESDRKICMAKFGKKMQLILEFEGKLPGRSFFIISNTSYFTTVYFIFKFLTLTNVIFQFWVMNQYLNTAYTFWGYGILRDLMAGRTWQESGHFPRETFCDFQRRDETSSKIISRSIQCVLMMNFIHEKICIFLWFWLLLLAFLNFKNFIYWFYVTFIPSCQRSSVKGYLYAAELKYDEEDIQEFIDQHLFLDGLTALRLIAKNAGHHIAAEIMASIYIDYFEKKYDCKIVDPDELGIKADNSKKDADDDDSDSDNNDIFHESVDDDEIPPLIYDEKDGTEDSPSQNSRNYDSLSTVSGGNLKKLMEMDGIPKNFVKEESENACSSDFKNSTNSMPSLILGENVPDSNQYIPIVLQSYSNAADSGNKDFTTSEDTNENTDSGLAASHPIESNYSDAYFPADNSLKLPSGDDNHQPMFFDHDNIQAAGPVEDKNDEMPDLIVDDSEQNPIAFSDSLLYLSINKDTKNGEEDPSMNIVDGNPDSIGTDEVINSEMLDHKNEAEFQYGPRLSESCHASEAEEKNLTDILDSSSPGIPSPNHECPSDSFQNKEQNVANIEGAGIASDNADSVAELDNQNSDEVKEEAAIQ